MKKNILFREFLKRQKKDIQPIYKLSPKDIMRLLKFIETSPFNNDMCCLWNGYMYSNIYKKIYAYFLLNNKNMQLHRILYINYIGKLGRSEYMTLSCKSGRQCCNINHLAKKKKKKILNPSMIHIINRSIATEEEKKRLTVIFD